MKKRHHKEAKPAVKAADKPPRQAVQPPPAEVSEAPRPPVKKVVPRETAESMAGKQKEIAVSEFFAKNRHLLGFDNPRKALLTCVKEAVDNSLDACEEAGILPEVWVIVEALHSAGHSHAEGTDNQAAPLKGLASKRSRSEETQPSLLEAVHPEMPHGVSPSVAKATRFRVTVRDNGPGIVRTQIPHVFGRLLYGSKFHRLRMSRGQQGIGISAAGMYGLLTTGRSVEIISRTGKKKPAHRFELQMDTQKNRAEIIVDQEQASWKPLPPAGWSAAAVAAHATVQGSLAAEPAAVQTDKTLSFAAWRHAVAAFEADPAIEEVQHGTEVSIVLEARFQRGRASVDEYLEQAAIANPHAQIHYIAPDGLQRLFSREINEVPRSPSAIKPHPYGVELGVMIRMLKETKHKHLGAFLHEEFSRVSPAVAEEICQKAGLTTMTWCAQVAREQADRLHVAIQQTKIMAPPTNCLVPIGPQQILKGLLKEIKAEFYAAETRDPAVYRGNPFQIEVGLAYGGQLPTEESARVIRFANRVPLLYQPSACAITKSVLDANWRNYGLTQPRNGPPEGPLVIFVHMASVWVPFTSESKEAIASYDEIIKEIKLALQECGRKLSTYIRRRQHAAHEGQRRHIFEKYIGEVVTACSKMTRVNKAELYKQLQAIAKSRTLKADAQFDDEGNLIKLAEKPAEKDENVFVVERADPAVGE